MLFLYKAKSILHSMKNPVNILLRVLLYINYKANMNLGIKIWANLYLITE